MAISYITNFGGRIATLHKLAQKLWFWCIDRNIWISAAHVPGKCNVEADKLSRQLNDDLNCFRNSKICWGILTLIYSQVG